MKPKRTKKDLILRKDLFDQVLEIVAFTEALPTVSREWGFARRATGGDGLKVLFSGDPGTGKTLAAEVIASELDVPLVKLHAGRLLSKWVGEFEQNADLAFAEARSIGGVLFVDECDALCGKRAEIRYASDRYANNEVTHIMTQLEDFEGLCVMATNLRENMDPAFMRRIHLTLPFPRPDREQRLRLWKWALGESADNSIDLTQFAALDLTGAAIMSCARTAALLAVSSSHAAAEPLRQVDAEDLVRAVMRQFRREGRILDTSELGAYKNYAKTP